LLAHEIPIPLVNHGFDLRLLRDFCSLKTDIENSEVSVEEIIEDKIDIILEKYILPIFKA